MCSWERGLGLTCREKVSSRSVSIRPLGGSMYSFDLKIRLEPCRERTHMVTQICLDQFSPIWFDSTQFNSVDAVVLEHYYNNCRNVKFLLNKLVFIHTHTHTHTHRQWERERNSREIYSPISSLSILQYLIHISDVLDQLEFAKLQLTAWLFISARISIILQTQCDLMHLSWK